MSHALGASPLFSRNGSKKVVPAGAHRYLISTFAFTAFGVFLTVYTELWLYSLMSQRF